MSDDTSTVCLRTCILANKMQMLVNIHYIVSDLNIFALQDSTILDFFSNQ